MKKRYHLSFTVGILSGLTAIGFAVLMVYSAVRIKLVAEVITDTTDDLAGINLLAFAGISYLVAILIAVISFALAGYRATLAYFYIKTALSGEKFYEERRKSVIGFSVLAFIMLGALISAYLIFDVLENKTLSAFLIALSVDYFLLAVIPLIERRIVKFIANKKQKVEIISGEEFNKEKITEELDELADEKASSSEIEDGATLDKEENNG